MENREKSKLVKWLDQLQQESWQLELVVSGFAIFLLIGALEALNELNFVEKLDIAGLGQQGAMLQMGYLILAIACFIILINLVLHVLLRGIWISAVGLRYVSGDIDFDSLKLSGRFNHFLRRRMGSFDDYILKLENVCSLVFAFTFLIVFMLLGVALSFTLFLLLIFLFEHKLDGMLSDGFGKIIGIPVILTFAFTSIIYFIDFITLGWLKRLRWFTVVYYPVYRFFSFITLASLYRPLYYNLVDNRFGRRVGFLLVPYVVVVIFLLTFKIDTHEWFPDTPGKAGLLKSNYDDLRPEGQRIYFGSIPSKFIQNGFLEIFLHYRPASDNKLLADICPGFRPGKEAGFGTMIRFSVDRKQEKQKVNEADSALACLSNIYEIHVDDSLFHQPSFKFYKHPNDEEYGLLTVLDVNGIARGLHHLRVKKLAKAPVGDSPTLQMQDYFVIPFWKE